ncbi:MAG: acyl-CoA dehydrogenase [Lachnospiraceae bacterium]|nr:acyl-CoA dehydrogenase [Lachnospiraceae bacterium]MCI8872551.1 acyl-CoA dehydrogenase [Lachnospiraceae bacterium]MCI9058423.1 acyl-CoA dehydrogenase [Lachnospiraceae bacterium]
MDFRITEEQELMVQAIEEALTRENLESYFQDCDKNHEHPEKFWDILKELGCFSMFLPEEAGGDGEGAVTMFLVMEALGRCGAPVYLFWDHVKADALLENGTKEQIDKFMPLFFEGHPAYSQGFSEPTAGTDLSSNTILTTYTRKNGKVYINGHKHFISGAQGSDYCLTLAKNSENPEQLTLWFVPTNVPECKKEPMETMGLHMENVNDIWFDNVEIEEKDMFSTEGNGLLATSKGFDYERLIDAFNAYGQALCAFEDACRYANQRVAFGKEIGKLQLIQNHIMEMAMRIYSMRDMLLHFAWNKDNDMLKREEASIAKQYCSEAANEVVDHAMQVMAGIGFCGSRVSRIYRDLRITRISGGTGEIQTVIASKQILRKYK